MTRVHPQIEITGIDSVYESASDSGVDTVITVCQDSVEDNVSEHLDYHWFNMSDGPHGGYGGDHSYELFAEAASLLLDELQRGNVVHIHCHMGQSRSVSVAAAAWAVYEDCFVREALTYIKEDRGNDHYPNDLLVEHAKTFVEENT